MEFERCPTTGETWRLHGPDTGLTNPNVIYLLEDQTKGGILALKAAEQVTIAGGVATITQGVVQLTSESSTKEG